MVAAIFSKINPPNGKFSVNLGTKVRNCWTYCREKGWKVEYIFVDRHERKDKMDTSSFKSMIKKAKAGDFDAIVFCNLDKFDESVLLVSWKNR